MNPHDQSPVNLREIVFDTDVFFDREKMLDKLDQLIHAWGLELLQKNYIDDIPDSDEAWLKTLDVKLHWDDLKDQWDFYVTGGLIFFVSLRADIRRDFLLQPDNIRGQRLSKWLWPLKHYMTPLLRDIVTKFCLCYSMILERKPITVRYNELKA